MEAEAFPTEALFCPPFPSCIDLRAAGDPPPYREALRLSSAWVIDPRNGGETRRPDREAIVFGMVQTGSACSAPQSGGEWWLRRVPTGTLSAGT